MQDGILKESIKWSPRFDKLSWFEQCVFVRLAASVDSHGLYDGRAGVVKHLLFPTKDDITTESVEKALNQLEHVGLIERCVIGDVPYICMTLCAGSLYTPATRGGGKT